MPVYLSSVSAYAISQSDSNRTTGCRLNQFCCGYSLRTGTKIIGFLSLLGGIASFIHSCIVFSKSNNAPNESAVLLLGINEHYYKIHMTSFVTSSIAIVCSIPVLVMAQKNFSPRLLVPWLVVNIVPSLGVIGFFIFLGVVELITEGLDDIIEIIVITAGVLSGAIWFYFWLVIYSFYQNQKNMEREPLLDVTEN
uniref:Uncharacterized protein n=1 Tax=Daphnia galeata TaxID=27404 RepID=A0A8J2RTR3_9CRUS|nr:unnamed protein product [Daphnia galeata]